MKILLVEDNELTRNTVKALLTRLGHEVVAEAENGEKAVKYFSEFNPEAVFLDLIMPGKSGLEIMEDLRKLDPLARVVVITAVDQDDMDRRLYDKGVWAILRKPFSFDDFKVLMKDLAVPKTETNRLLKTIAASGMQKCAERLSRISAGKWSVGGIRVSHGSLEETLRARSLAAAPGFAVYFSVTGEYPFTTMAIFRPEDAETISRGFLGFAFTPEDPGRTCELLFSELGNIVLNSFISALSNKLKRGFLPEAPRCLRGENQFLLETLWATLDGRQHYSVAGVTLDLECGGQTVRSEILAVIPASLEQALAAG